MKKILFILSLLPALIQAQEKGDYFISYNLGVIEDVYQSDLDINAYSQDMQSDAKSDKKYGHLLAVGYHIQEKLIIGVNYMSAEIHGANEVEYYNNSFTEKNIFIKYNLFKKGKFSLLASGSCGEVSFEGSRNFVFDDGLVNKFKDKSRKGAYGGELMYNLSDKISLNLKIMRNEIKHDGFDGWDYGSASDRYLYKSIGARIYL